MHVLITSDTVGGVWTYTQELVTGLAQAGHRVTLVSFGKLPVPHQTTWMRNLPGVDYRPTEYRLEWMEVAERDIAESKRYLELLIDEVRPDLLHFSQYCYGDLPTRIPKVVVAHSDIVSWWFAVYGREPDDTPWMRNYRETVLSGLNGADLVVAPSRWMLDQVSRFYKRPALSQVIYNGRTPTLFEPRAAKRDMVLSVARVWDPAKNVTLLLDRTREFPARIVGWEREPGRADRSRSVPIPSNAEVLGAKSQSELREIYAEAQIYAATSKYEPFGLAPLEAAFSGCCLVLNDNPVFHELWDGAGLFFEKDDSEALARVITELRQNPELLQVHAACAYDRACEKFTAGEMVKQYECAYQEVSAAAQAL